MQHFRLHPFSNPNQTKQSLEQQHALLTCGCFSLVLPPFFVLYIPCLLCCITSLNQISSSIRGSWGTAGSTADLVNGRKSGNTQELCPLCMCHPADLFTLCNGLWLWNEFQSTICVVTSEDYFNSGFLQMRHKYLLFSAFYSGLFTWVSQMTLAGIYCKTIKDALFLIKLWCD